MKTVFKKLFSLLLVLILCAGLCSTAFAADGTVSGKVVIYSSMYPFVLQMLDDALKKEFPNLTPGNGDSFFVYGGSTSLISQIYADMKFGELSCDMMLVAEPSLALELKEAGYLEPVPLDDPDQILRFPYDEDGCWYPVRVCNMILAYNPKLEDEWAAQGVSIPKTFRDFAMDPSLAEKIAMGDPLFSGTTYAAVASLMQADHYGRQYLKKLAANDVQINSGSTSIAGVRNGELAAIMILEESVLKALKDAEDAGAPLTDLKVIYPEDGVILIPSPVMTVTAEHSKNKNVKACKAIEKWFLSEKAQKIIMQGYMHSVFTDMQEIPWGSVDTAWLIEKDMSVKWENAYLGREDINNAWTDIVIYKKQVNRKLDRVR